MEVGFAPVPAFPGKTSNSGGTSSASGGDLAVDLAAQQAEAAAQQAQQARLAQQASTYAGRAELLAEAKSREELPDSPPENSLPCGACYSPTCQDCSLLPCVIAAVAAAAKSAVQGSQELPAQFTSGFNASASAYGPYSYKGAPIGQVPLPGKRDHELSLADLLVEIRGVNQNVDNKFQTLQQQFVQLQQEIGQLRVDIVSKAEFEALNVSVAKLDERIQILESGTGDTSGNNKQVQVLRKQLDRLDPAHKCLKLQGFVDANLASRVARIKEIVSGVAGFPDVVSCDTIHKGKRDARVPTHMTLIEFQSNSDREKALVLLEGKNMTDSSGAVLVSKRAQTEIQRDRNIKLQKAEEMINKETNEIVKIVLV